MRAAAALGRRTLPRAADVLRHAAELARRAVHAPSSRMRRRLLVAALLACALGSVYMLWFRDSSFVRVEHVRVTGLDGTDAPREKAALIAAAKGMTTLHVDESGLRDALSAGATIEAIHVTTSFPHGIRIQVVEKTPVAVLVYGSDRVAVGRGGVLLPGVQPIPRALPIVNVGALPRGDRLGSGRANKLVAVAAAAPAPLRARIDRLRTVPGKGLVAYIGNGPQVILGSALDLPAKWIAAAAILADPQSHGASYIDVRLPDRPVAGGLAIAPPPADDQPSAPPPQVTPPGTTAAPTAGAPATATPTPTASTGTTTGTAGTP